MVQGVKRKTFEKKLHDADKDWLEYERTSCVLVRLYGVEELYKILINMANREGWKTYKITDEKDSYDGYPLFTSRGMIIKFVSAHGVPCSFELFDTECSECECTLNSNRCMEQRHLNSERLRSRIYTEYERRKLL